MDRLSARIDNFQGELDEIAFINPDDPEGMYNLRDIVKYSGDERLYKIAERFCAYEDTGLEPDEIPHWIPVTKKLPEDESLVLTCGERGIDIDYYDSSTYMPGWKSITYWMPLSQPPKGEKQ